MGPYFVTLANWKEKGTREKEQISAHANSNNSEMRYRVLRLSAVWAQLSRQSIDASRLQEQSRAVESQAQAQAQTDADADAARWSEIEGGWVKSRDQGL